MGKEGDEHNVMEDDDQKIVDWTTATQLHVINPPAKTWRLFFGDTGWGGDSC